MATRDEFTDSGGRSWRRDPTGRFTYRQFDGEQWTALVCMTPRQAPGTDAEGAVLSNGDDPKQAAPVGRPVQAKRSAGHSATWQDEVATVSVDVDLESWLNGGGGWELVSVAGAAGGSFNEGGELTAILKRPLPL